MLCQEDASYLEAHGTPENADMDAPLMTFSIPALNLLVPWVGYCREYIYTGQLPSNEYLNDVRSQLVQGFINITVFEVTPLKTFGLLSFVILAI